MNLNPLTWFQRKSISYLDQGAVDAFLGLASASPDYVTPQNAYVFNRKNNDLGKATKDIADEISSFKKALRNKDTKELDFSAPLVQLLNRPRGGMSANQFWFSIVESFLLTEEVWIVARGRVNAEPQELIFIRPYDVSALISTSDGLPEYIQTQSAKDRNIYYREERNGIYRYIDRAGLNEIIPIIGAISEQDEWRGRSPLTKLLYDIDMNTEGKRHNVSLIKNGMRSSGMISPAASAKEEKPSFGKDAIKAITERLRQFNQGAGNAGNIFVAGRPATFTNFGQSNTDMDFLNLLRVSRESIYNLYNYPLPLVLSDAMTLDNYKTAINNFYTNAVFPVYNKIAAGLMEGLKDRFKLTESEELSFSEVDITALRPVLVDNMVKLKDTESVSKDEIRSVGGYVPVEGGGTILVSANQVPLSSVSSVPEFGEPVPDEDIDDDPDEDEDDEDIIDE